MALSSMSRRAQAALNDQLSVAREYFSRRIMAAILATEDSLFKRAERSANNAEQQQLLAAVTEIKRQRETVAARIMELLAARIENYGAVVEDEGAQQAKPSERLGLSLMTKKVQDESVVLESFATRVEGHAALSLFELGHRYAVLAAAPVFESTQQPFSPVAVCACLRQATADLNLPPEYKLELYQSFDREVLQSMAGLYDTLNKRLSERGILPHLRRFALKRRTPAPRTQFAPPEAMPGTDEEKPATVPSGAAATAAAQAASGGEASTYQDVMQLLAFRRAPSDGMSFDPAPMAKKPKAGQQAGQQAGQTATPAAGPVATPSRADLNRVLGQLQQQALSQPAKPGAPATPPSIQDLRQAMLDQLQQDNPGAIPTLTLEQSNIIDLMTMVFDRLSADVNSAPEDHLLRELQAPMLRVAMTDQTFFTDQQHSARNWLDKVAEALSEWSPDVKAEDGDASLMERIQDMNHAIGRDFDGDVSIFDKMVGDLQKQLDQLARRAAVIEKRYVEVARGRERLDLARRQAEALVNERIKLGDAPSLGRTLFQHAWTDVLTLTLLRQGEDSKEFQRNLKIADVLGQGMPDVTPEKASLMRRSVAQILMGVGFEAKEAILLVNEITNNRRESLKEEGVSREEDVEHELERKLKTHKPVGHEQQTEDDRIANVAPLPEDAADEKVLAAMEEIKQMPFGTWFDFDDPDGGPAVRRRIAWFSTRTGRCLFVNRNGVRSHDTTIRHVAEAMAAGKARLAPAHKGGFFTRVMDKIHDSLKKMSSAEMPEGQIV